MKEVDISERIEAIFRDVFDDDSLHIGSATTANDVEDWDSLMQINLVVAMEQEFNVRFALGELRTLKNVGEMVAVIYRKLHSDMGENT